MTKALQKKINVYKTSGFDLYITCEQDFFFKKKRQKNKENEMIVNDVFMHTVVCTVQGRFVCARFSFSFFNNGINYSFLPAIRATMLMYKNNVGKEEDTKEV